ncbi:MAG: hypothetical protein FJ308_10240 [Planctomycetes bacterium]|nr:hypothetical protein [Planctomycetota bacterium]
MNESLVIADRIEGAALRLLGQHSSCHTIVQWCDEYRRQANDIMSGRGIALPSFAIVGAKGQGKTWVARQMLLDERVAESLPSGVLSSEATTQLHWIGPVPPEALDPSKEVYVPCPAHRMLDMGRPYLLIDTPGYTDDDPTAAAIARDSLSFSPIKLLVARRDQLRSAIHSQLAALTDGAVCIPLITCVPLKEISTGLASRGNGDRGDAGDQEERVSESLRGDLEWYRAALTASAPNTRFLDPIIIADFEADGDEERVGERLRLDLKERLSRESIDAISATKASRLASLSDRLRHRVSQLIDRQVPQLAQAVRKLHTAADALPSQAIETVLGSKQVLKTAIRDRIRADVIGGTGLFCFPYRTLLNVLGFTHGAWDRLLLSMTGSIPSIFVTFAAWAKNLATSREANQGLQQGIRDQLNRQIQDRLQPAQQQFYRTIDRIRGDHREGRSVDGELRVRLTGVDELQSQAREVFDFTLEKNRASRVSLLGFAALGTFVFWGLMAGPIISIYRQYFYASYRAWTDASAMVESFPHPSPGMLFTSTVISLVPVLVFAMLVMSWYQRVSRLNALADNVYAAELSKVEELKRLGVIQLHYEDSVLEAAEFLVNLEAKTQSGL